MRNSDSQIRFQTIDPIATYNFIGVVWICCLPKWLEALTLSHATFFSRAGKATHHTDVPRLKVLCERTLSPPKQFQKWLLEAWGVCSTWCLGYKSTFQEFWWISLELSYFSIRFFSQHYQPLLVQTLWHFPKSPLLVFKQKHWFTSTDTFMTGGWIHLSNGLQKLNPAFHMILRG